MVQTPPKTTKRITLAEFLKLPESKPASEFINGQIIQKPMPQGKHSAIQGEFVPTINGVVKAKRIARAFPELRCTFGERSIVPDIAVFIWERIPRDENGEIANVFGDIVGQSACATEYDYSHQRISNLEAPDWTIEILLPDQRQTKVMKNICTVSSTMR